MREMRKAKDGEDERNTHRAQGIDAAHGDTWEEIQIAEIGQGFQFIHPEMTGRFRNWPAMLLQYPCIDCDRSPGHNRDARWRAPGVHSVPQARFRCRPC